MMTLEQIERRVERMMDHLDSVFLNGDMTQKNYDLAVAALDRWAEQEYALLRANPRANLSGYVWPK